MMKVNGHPDRHLLTPCSLKAWTARIYYATKPGFDELNKGSRIPATFACKIA